MKNEQYKPVEGLLKSVLSSITTVDIVEDSFRADYFAGELTLQMEYLDMKGEPGTLCISSGAIRNLADKLQDVQMAMLERSVHPDKGLAFDLVTGPTRGEVYFPGGDHAV